MYKYILFDFDGTLVNTNDLILLALNEAALKFTGRELTSEDYNAILGKFLEDQMKMLSPEYYKEMMAFYREFYIAREDAMTKEFQGVKDMLDSLKEAGCRLAIVSAKGRRGILHSLKLFHMEAYFDAIISADDVTAHKPDPEPALKAMEALGADPAGTVIVGDSPYDILCGKNAGIKTVLVAWTILPMETLMALRPDYVIQQPDDIMDMVKG